jgi:hypothetical protein
MADETGICEVKLQVTRKKKRSIKQDKGKEKAGQRTSVQTRYS